MLRKVFDNDCLNVSIGDEVARHGLDIGVAGNRYSNIAP